MLGAIFGDIAGSIYEFNNIKSTKFDLFGKGTQFTDDSILTIAVADWLIGGVLVKDRLIYTIKEYVNEFPNPMGGYGTHFLRWAKSCDTEPYYSWGNGSAMRVSPVGWAFDSLDETERIAGLTSEITHNHPEGIKGAQAIAAAIYMARTCSTKKEIKEYIETNYGYNLSRTCDEIRPDYSFNESCQGTVPEAITAFLYSIDFESAIRLAVSLGGDSDTLACITGGIAEAFYGMKMGIPVSHENNGVHFYYTERVLDKLPANLRSKAEEFYKVIIIPHKVFWAKNESTTELKNIDWIRTDLDNKCLTEESYKSFLKGYAPDWDMRFGVYFEDGWHYIYRSHYLLKKFSFIKKDNGLYYLNETFTSDHDAERDLIEEVLCFGYFDPPYFYKNSEDV